MRVEKITSLESQESKPQQWSARDELYMAFNARVYGDCFDSETLRMFLASSTGERVLTAEERAPYRAQMEASGLTPEDVHERIVDLLSPLGPDHQAIVDVCIGLSAHHIPTPSEAARQLGLSEKYITTFLEEYRDSIATFASH